MTRKLMLVVLTVGLLASVVPGTAYAQAVTVTREAVPVSPIPVVKEVTVVQEPAPIIVNKVLPPKVTYNYEFFPDSQVYFNNATRMWFWKENGAWHSGYRLPARFTPLHNQQVKLEIDSDTPYVYHEHHLAPGIVKKELHPVVNETRIITKVEPPRRLYEYTYFPDAGVYFDANTSQYLWMENGVWRVSSVLPSYIHIDPALSEAIVLERDVRISLR